MYKKLAYLFAVVLVSSWATAPSLGGVSYPDPPGGWTYIYQGNTVASTYNAALDGTWDHYDAGTGGSDAWDGLGIGTGIGTPGGVSALLDGATTFLRIQDCGDPRDYGISDPTNRKITFAHNITNEVANGTTILNDGVTLSFRARIPTTAPLDSHYPNGGGGIVAWTTMGYNIHDDGYGAFGIKQGTGGNGVISFSLCMDTDAGTISGNGLTMNKRNGTAVSGTVDSEDSGGTENTLLGFDPTQWHEFWIVIQADTSGGGTHKVMVYMDGSVTPTVFHVTAGTKDEYDWSGYLLMSIGRTDIAGAQDVDFFAYKGGRVHPPGAMTKAYEPNPPNGATNVIPGTLSWTAGVTAAAHDVYLGTNANAVANATTSSTEYRDQTNLTQYFVTGLTAATTYYWRIDEVEEGGTVYAGYVWSFTTPGMKAYNPSPADGATLVDPNVVLAWSRGFNAKAMNGHDVYLGTNATAVANANTSSPEFKANRSASNYPAGLLEYDRVYYWRIDERNTDTSVTPGDVWSLKTQPFIPVADDPNLLCWWKFDEGSGTAALDWSGHNHHGTIERDPQWVDGLAGGALDFGGDGDRVVDNAAAAYLNGLSALTVCVWVKSDLTNTDKGFVSFEDPSGSDSRDIRYDAAGSTAGGTNVIKYGITSTGGGQENESSSGVQVTDWQHIAVTWSSGAVMRLYINGVLDTPSSEDAATTGTITGCTKVVVGQGCKDAGGGWAGLIDDVRIYKTALTVDGIKQAMRGDPKLAWEPKPANGSTADLGSAPPVSWSAGSMASSHDVYFGTDRATVANATTSTAGVYRVRQIGTNYTPPETLNGLQTYYWRIDEYNSDTTITTGLVWSFTLANYRLVDDFETYTDISPSIIWQTWIDSLGYTDPPPGVPGNGSNGIVGYGDTPYAEVVIVHAGKQSMRLDYTNSASPYYSETYRDFGTPQNWTAYGAKALTLWYRGYWASVGSFTESPPGNYTITAAGADIFDVAAQRGPGFHDEFHYAYKQITVPGPVTIIAKVESVDNTNAWAKAGLMVRDSLDADSIHAMMCITPGQGVALQYRALVGGPSTNATQQTGITAPQWLKLVYDTTTGIARASYSADGLTWTDLGTQQYVAMTDPIYIGLSLTAHNVNATCTARFSNVSITGAAGAWSSKDIGIKVNVPEPMYVALQSGLNTAVVQHEADPNAVLQGAWQEWNIDLKSFAGINLNAVKKMIIGTGKRNAPQAGSAGTVYFDDIRLYQARYIPGKGTLLTADISKNGVVNNEDLAIIARDWLEYDYTKTGKLLLRWAFEEGSGGTVGDGSGNGHTGNIYGADWATPGYNGSGYCLDFNGLGDYVLNNDINEVLDGLDALTVSAWIRSDANNTDKGFIIFENPDSDDSRDMRYDAAGGSGGGTNVMKVGITATDGEQKLESSSSVQKVGIWQHVAIAWTRGQHLKLYIDGALNAQSWLETNTNPRIGTLVGYTRLMVGKGGKDNAANLSWDGRIDDVRIYNYALSQTDIQAVMNGQTLPPAQIYMPVLSPANIYDAEPQNFKKVNLKDSATLTNEWQKQQVWPEW